MRPTLRRLLVSLSAAAVVSLCVTPPSAGQASAPAQAPAGGLRWTKAAPFPEPEEELYGTVVNGKWYVLGGFGIGGNAPGMVYEYDAGADRWTKTKNMPLAVHHQAQAGFNGKLYVFGGCLKGISGEGGTQNAWEYDPAADAWRALAQIPVKRCSAIAEEVGGKIYLIGGLEPLENGRGTRVSGLNQVYDPATDRWSTLSPMPTTRNHAFSGVVNGKIYVIGGRLGAGNIPATSNTDVVEEYDPATNLWGPIKERMPTPRSGGGATVCNGRIYAGGGELVTREMYAAFEALEAYEPASNTWQVLPSFPGTVHGNAMGCIGGRLHTVSGKTRSGGPQDAPDPATASHDVLDVSVLGAPQPSTLRWVKAAPFPEPEEELYGTAVNGKMYVIGGFGTNGTPAPAMVYEYDAAADRWAKKNPIPVAVHHQAQTEYRGKIYVFGGCTRPLSGTSQNGWEPVNNAWEFDPASNTWRALAPMPMRRCAAVAEQVDGKIYVIGGATLMENSSETALFGNRPARVLGTNQVYDVATNTWAARSAMPTGRNHAFSGVVNGKIYVIGGRLGAAHITASSNTDVVEEYDPARDAWGAVKAPMPTARSGGGWATYNGRIYVSGGELQNSRLHGSFRAFEAYEPATNRWIILPSIPGARHGNAAAFIGNRFHTVSGKPEGGGLPDLGGKATVSHDVLEIPAAGGTN